MVVMRNHRSPDPEIAEQVDPRFPRWVGPRLVNLVHRDGKRASGNCGRRGKDNHPAFTHHPTELLGDVRVPPLPQGEAWRPRSSENVSGARHHGEPTLPEHHVRPIEPVQAGGRERLPDVDGEPIKKLRCHFLGIDLEPIRCLQQHARLIKRCMLEQFSLKAAERRGCLTRAD